MHTAYFCAVFPSTQLPPIPLPLNLLVQINVTKSLLINILWLLIPGKDAVLMQLPVEARHSWTHAKEVQM